MNKIKAVDYDISMAVINQLCVVEKLQKIAMGLVNRSGNQNPLL